MQHVIEIDEIGEERTYWQCSCGTSGSCPSHMADVAAEKHVPDGDSVTYRYPAR